MLIIAVEKRFVKKMEEWQMIKVIEFDFRPYQIKPRNNAHYRTTNKNKKDNVETRDVVIGVKEEKGNGKGN